MGDNGAFTALVLKIQVFWDATLRRLQRSFETPVTLKQQTSPNATENLNIQGNLILHTFPLSINSRKKIVKVYYYYYCQLLLPREELSKKAHFRSGTYFCRSLLIVLR